MKFTEEQIARLYRFTREHFVEHYDVQTELVDHLANDIESIIAENPKLTFDEALQSSFKKFGVFGFMDIVEAKNKAMGKKYKQLVWTLFKEFFTIPHIAVSLTIFLVFVFLLHFFNAEYVIVIFSLTAIMVMTFKLFQFKKEQKKRQKISEKKWLLEDFVYNLGGLALLMNLFFQIAFYTPRIMVSDYQMLAALFLTVIVLLVYITVFLLPKQIDAILNSQYPEYKLI